MVTIAPVLNDYDCTRPEVFQTNSSHYVNSRVLLQADNNGVLYPIDFYSKNLLLAEYNYEINDKELLAIFWCLKYWLLKLEWTDVSVVIFTYHRSLEYLIRTKVLTKNELISISKSCSKVEKQMAKRML